MLRKVFLFLAVAVGLFVAFVLALVYWPYAEAPPARAPEYADLDFAAAEAKAAEIVDAMTLEEKVEQLHGDLGTGPSFWR